MENETPDTSNHLNWVEIKNFKSIKDLRLDCKRVNVFIGKPNVGKSNILEGLGLLGAGYIQDRFMDGAVRYKEMKHLFFDNDRDNLIRITSDKGEFFLQVMRNNNSDFVSYLIDEHIQYNNEQDLKIQLSNVGGKLTGMNIKSNGLITEYMNGYRPGFCKKYDFNNIDTFSDSFNNFLSPPNGSNLFSIIDKSHDLKNEFGQIFQQQGLDFVLSREDQTLELQRKDGFYVIKYPFFSIADTFRRFMFYITAIESNTNSVIIFEEPEVHSFPPYTQELGQRVILSDENQFFISTHSPYLLHTLIENLEINQLNVFVTYYENYETKVRSLTAEELRKILDFSTDVFFNLDKFIPNAQPFAAA